MAALGHGESVTAAPHSEPSAKGDAPDWKTQLRSRGYRLTAQRGLVLEAVQTLEHATPEEISSYLSRRATGINVSTVYRTLDLLESLGLVRHTHLAHGAPTYHSAAVPAHIHLVCRECSGVTEVPTSTAAPLVSDLSERLGFQTDVNHLTVFGTCALCAAAVEQRP